MRKKSHVRCPKPGCRKRVSRKMRMVGARGCNRHYPLTQDDFDRAYRQGLVARVFRRKP